MNNLERRQTPRTPIAGHAYVNIEPNNGGMVLNVSDGGLCFHSFDPVQRNGKVRFWFAGKNRRIEADAALAWTDETHKAGLRFTALPEEAREHIRKWMIQSATPLPAGEGSGSEGLPPRPFRNLNNKQVAVSAPPLVPAPLAAVSTRSEVPTQASGFSRGLFTGILISAFVAGAFLFQNYRREFGESLIRLGERFAAKPAAQTAVMPPPTPLVTPGPPVSQVTLPAVASPSVPPSSKAMPPAEKSAQRQEKPEPEPEVITRTFVNPVKPSQPRLDPARPITGVSPTATGTLASKPPAASAAPAISTPPPASLSTPAPASGSNLAADRSSSTPKFDAAKPPEVQAESTVAGNEASTSELYFDVGKFKNQSQAHIELDKLSQLGFPATAVQKGFLWTNSYHILVGPYSDEERAKATRQSLMSSGFKPRPFERGSRPFTLSSEVKVNGTRTPAGDYIISWESSLDDASVRLLHNDYPVATANGRWVKHDAKFPRDAYVYRHNPDGSRTLLELRFGGTRQSLVFGKSS
jgi:PilZ domain/SPOR domain